LSKPLRALIDNSLKPHNRIRICDYRRFTLPPDGPARRKQQCLARLKTFTKSLSQKSFKAIPNWIRLLYLFPALLDLSDRDLARRHGQHKLPE
jgi:hypothetical protein